MQKVINNFRQIVELVGKDIEAMSGGSEPPKYSESEQKAICDAFRNVRSSTSPVCRRGTLTCQFVVVHQNLLKTVIGKEGFLSNTPYTAPMAAVLRTLEAGVDKLAYGIIDSVPTCADSAKKNKKMLDSTLANAVDAYS